MAIPACASLDRMCFSALAICKVAVKEAMVFLSIFMLLARLLVGGVCWWCGVCWWVVFAGGVAVVFCCRWFNFKRSQKNKERLQRLSPAKLPIFRSLHHASQ